jgi:hypothetical protein
LEYILLGGIFTYQFKRKQNSLIMNHHNTPLEDQKPIVCYIPEDEKIKIDNESLDEMNIDLLSLVDLAAVIEQFSEQAEATNDKKLTQRLRIIVNDACAVYNRRVGFECFIAKFNEAPSVKVKEIKVTDLKKGSDVLPERKGKEAMVDLVKRIKSQIALGASNADIEKSVGLSASFISKVRSGNKYPEVKI